MWIDSNPQLLLSLPEDYVKLIDIPHTPLLAYITRFLVVLINQYTLVPVTTHTRDTKLNEQHGINVDIKTKHIHVQLAQLNKVIQFQLVVQTSMQNLILYHGKIEPNRNLYEVIKNDNLIQLGLPLAGQGELFLIKLMLLNATRLLSVEDGVERIEAPGGEDEENFSIELVKLVVSKVLKISIGVSKWWLKATSHNLIVFNNSEDDCLQVVNLQNFKNEVIVLTEQRWYLGSRIRFIEYNEYKNYFLLVNDAHELWYMELAKGDHGVTTKGHRIKQFNPINSLSMRFSSSGVFLIKVNSQLRIYSEKLVAVKAIPVPEKADMVWAPSGKFFILSDQATGYYRFLTRMGHTTFDSQVILAELSQKFLVGSTFLITGNSNTVLVIGEKLWQIPLQHVTETGKLFYNYEYLGEFSRAGVKHPMPPRFKKIISRMDGDACRFDISTNINRQYALSFGDHIAVSTPTTSSPIRWYHYSHNNDPINVITTGWYKEYLILVVEGEEKNEVIVLDTRKTKYQISWYRFNEDSIIHRVALDGKVHRLYFEGDQLVLIIGTTITMVKFSGDNRKVTLEKTSINLLPISNKLAVSLITQCKKIGESFLLLLSLGEFLILQHLLDHLYELVIIAQGIDWFRVDFVKYTVGGAEYIAALGRDTVFIYPLVAVVSGNAPEPIIIPIEGYLPLGLVILDKLVDLSGVEPTVHNNFLRNKGCLKVVLHHFIEHELIHTPKEEVNHLVTLKFSRYEMYTYCLELLLVRYLTEVENPSVLDKLLLVVDNAVYINCLRKIEVGYWNKFFTALGITANDYMSKLIELGDVEQCYHYLIIYLNADTDSEPDKEVIVRIFNMLQDAGRWDWCFELSRFCKVLDPELLAMLVTQVKLNGHRENGGLAEKVEAKESKVC